ncbi:neutral/alkaline non-lysosomal ceramidase N-terminal domain-containing protein [Leptospira venezuelensis]|uniref:neutral/alkaline non-lysosomal ceramidase N-terminal domain-containing protein n=1 Tax=Leptospira venezuelensis TaxID=1958811 RepID=UPI000A360312|nr:neutral/alkaline non-lysosomal ceramidase N-terminal domain-containing protein [Leptospira venezuelensis]
MNPNQIVKKIQPYLVSILLIFSALSCGTVAEYKIAYKKPEVASKTRGLVAGISKVDLTPPPGLPLAGYSKMAETEKGFRTRLYARIFYIKKDANEPVVLIQSDLLSGSLLIHHLLAERLASKTDISFGGIVFAGTHTHSAPANFYDNNFYNEFASNKPGFDKGWTDFVLDRLTSGVEEAYKSAKPAKIASGKTAIWGLTRNRSLDAYRANKNSGFEELKPEIQYQAINPDLVMIRIDAQDKDGRYKPLGAFSTFSVHGTTVPDSNDVANADVFAYPTRILEKKIRKDFKPSWDPIHALNNSTHGDNSPDYREDMQGFIESRRIGEAIGAEAARLFDSLQNSLSTDANLSFNTREVDLYENQKIGDAEVCDRPYVGTALTGGAEDGLTPVLNWLPFFAEGWPRWFLTGGCQGHKRIVGFKYLQPIVLPKSKFPHKLLLQSVKIADTLLLPVPFEVTKESGKRFVDEALKSSSQPIKNASVISCANGYFGYVTTPEEYTRQHYEGGHTLYGPGTQPFLQAHLADLTKNLPASGGKESFPASWNYELDRSDRFPETEKSEGVRELVDSPELILAEENLEKHWVFRYKDVGRSEISLHESLVSIEYKEGTSDWKELTHEGEPVDDKGVDIEVRKTSNSGKGMAVYQVRWYNPEQIAKRKYRFVIRPRAGQAKFVSPEF